MRKNYLNFNGQMILSSETILTSLKPGHLSVPGVFETMRVHNGFIVSFNQHVQRMEKALKKLRLKNPMGLAKWRKSAAQLVKKNRVSSGRVRLCVYRYHRTTHYYIIALPQPLPSRSRYVQGYHGQVVDVFLNSQSPFKGLKAIPYQPFFNAFKLAQKRGADEAILLNEQNEVAEGSHSNIFYVRGGRLYTPALSSGCLNGVTRQNVLSLARKQSIVCASKRVNLSDLKSCDEAFLTNSLIGIMPLTRLNSTIIARGRPGSMTQRLQAHYQQLVSAG